MPTFEEQAKQLLELVPDLDPILLGSFAEIGYKDRKVVLDFAKLLNRGRPADRAMFGYVLGYAAATRREMRDGTHYD